jgi:predicted transcriptional regulator
MPRTKLRTFLERENIPDTELARVSGASRRSIGYIKNGQQEPTRGRMAAILAACRKITQKRLVITDLFDFDTARKTRRKAA